MPINNALLDYLNNYENQGDGNDSNNGADEQEQPVAKNYVEPINSGYVENNTSAIPDQSYFDDEPEPYIPIEQPKKVVKKAKNNSQQRHQSNNNPEQSVVQKKRPRNYSQQQDQAKEASRALPKKQNRVRTSEKEAASKKKVHTKIRLNPKTDQTKPILEERIDSVVEENNTSDIQAIFDGLAALVIDDEQEQIQTTPVHENSDKKDLNKPLNEESADDISRFLEEARAAAAAKQAAANASNISDTDRKPSVNPFNGNPFTKEENHIPNKPFVEQTIKEGKPFIPEEKPVPRKESKKQQSTTTNITYPNVFGDEEVVDNAVPNVMLLLQEAETCYQDEWIETYERAQKSNKKNEVARKLKAGRFRFNKQHEIEILADKATNGMSSNDLLSDKWI